MKKKIFSLLIIAIMLFSSLFVFAGCGDEDEDETKSSKKNKTESSQSRNKIEDDDEDDDEEEEDDDGGVDASSIMNKLESNNTVKSDNKNTIASGSNSTSSGNTVKLTAINSELSKVAGQIPGISYGDIKVELEYDKSNEKILSAQISMSMTVTDSQMIAALDSIDLNSLFESSLSNQDNIKNAKTERVGNTIYFTADVDIAAAMAGEGIEKISLEDLKKSMTESSFVVTEE